MISMIVAMSQNRVIANASGIPWQGDLPADVAHFRDTTLGHSVIMGRGVYSEFTAPLPERQNIVLTHLAPENLAPGFSKINTIKEALELANSEHVYIIGGQKTYEQFIDYADELIVTTVHAYFDGSKYFPKIDEDTWTSVSSMDHPKDSENKYSFTISRYERLA